MRVYLIFLIYVYYNNFVICINYIIFHYVIKLDHILNIIAAALSINDPVVSN